MMTGARRGGLGIRVRLVLLIQGAMLALGVGTALVAASRERTALEDGTRRRAAATARDLAAFAVRPLLSDDLAGLRRFLLHYQRQDHVRSVTVLDTDGRVVMDTDLSLVGTMATDPFARRALQSSVPAWLRASTSPEGPGDPAVSIPVTSAGARLATVVLRYSLATTEAQVSSGRRQMLVMGAVAATLAGVLAYLLAHYISSPITRLAGAMATAARGETVPVLAASRSDEIGLLEASFNAMAADLGVHRRHMEELVSGRTAQLQSANARLAQEVADRTRAEADLDASRETLRRLASHLQSVRETERADIAREIHDELGQALTALKMDVHWLSARLAADPPLASKAQAMSKSIDGTVQTVRRIATALRPKLLDDLGLSAAVEWQAREFQVRSGIACDVRSDPDDIVIGPAASTALFRIFQEALTNVARHAAASRIEAELLQDGRGTALTVSDDGRGITVEQATAAEGLGIVGMRERAAALGGTFEISARPGGGTTLRAFVPAGGGVRR